MNKDKQQNAALEAERVAFEAAYAGEFNRVHNDVVTAEDVAAMREGDGYGDRPELNGQWKGWQARAQLAAPAGVPAEWAKLDPAFVVMFLRQSSAFDADLIGEMLNYAISAAAPSPAPASPNTIDLVFDGELPNAVFVEAEDGEGNSINAGHWFQREDGYWILRISSIERQLTQEEKDAAAHRYLARASAETWPKQQCPVTGAVTWVEPEDMGIEPPASDVVQVQRPLADRLLSRSDTTGYQLACAELRALLNGGRV